MAAEATVIDKLIVTLGLDPKDFKKGEKQAANDLIDLEKKVQGSTKSMNASLVGFSAKLLGVATAVQFLKKAFNYGASISESTRKLGIESRNLGLAAAELRNYENAVELIGGKADDAAKTVNSFNKSIFDLTYKGQMSDSLIMLARLGVQFQNADGSARDFKDVLLDTAEALEKTGMARKDAYQYAKDLGLDEGSIQLVLGGRSGAQSALEEQKRLRQVQPKDTGAATRIERSAIKRQQAIDAGAVGGLDKIADTVENINGALTHVTKVLTGQEGLSDAAQAAGASIRGLANNLATMAAQAEATSRRVNTVGLRNNNPGNLKAVGNQARDNMGFRVFGTMEEGIAAAEAQLNRYSKRGINTIESIVSTWAPSKDGNNVEAYIKDLEQQTGIKRGEKLDPSDHAMLLSAMFRHESGSGAPSVDAVADVLTYRNDAENSVVPSPGSQAAASNVTNVDIGSMTINTQATNADGIASDMHGAMKRKLMTAHAERGAQ